MYEEYTGKDLILATGAPGSRWSGILRMITSNIDINISDETPDRVYNHETINPDTGKLVTRGWHRGAYWGPDHEFGKQFDILDTLSKEQIVEDFKKPYTDWNHGKKIIKSHWFAYHLDYLKNMFPDAKFIGVQRTNEECFEWWHICGGWDISYPHYFWYKDDVGMKKQIAIENQNITNFFPTIRNNTIQEIFEGLGLPNKTISFNEFCKRDDKLADVLSKHDPKDDDYYPALNHIVERISTGVC